MSVQGRNRDGRNQRPFRRGGSQGNVDGKSLAFRALGKIGGLLLLAWLGGCDDQGESDGGSGSSSSLGSATSGGMDTLGAGSVESGELDCFSGELGCPCEPGGLCASGLACVDGTCEEPSGAEAGTGGGGATGDETGGGVDACAENFECDESEVCVFETCTPISVFDWRFSVTQFAPGGCRDGWGGAEVFYRYFEDGVEVEESPVAECPAQWSSSDLSYYTPGATFEIEFWELDFLFDDFFTRLCWADPLDEEVCGPVPDYVLHEGGFFGTLDDGAHTVEVRFEPEL